MPRAALAKAKVCNVDCTQQPAGRDSHQSHAAVVAHGCKYKQCTACIEIRCQTCINIQSKEGRCNHEPACMCALIATKIMAPFACLPKIWPGGVKSGSYTSAGLPAVVIFIYNQSVTSHQIMLSAALAFYREHCIGVLLLVVFVSPLYPR